MRAPQQLLRRRSGSCPTTPQEEEWELPSCIPGGEVGASQQLLRRRGASSTAEGTRVTLQDLLQNHFWDGLPNYRVEEPLRAFGCRFFAPRAIFAHLAPCTRCAAGKLLLNCSGGGMEASQPLLKRRSGSFPATAQEEGWELPNYCPGGGVGASQQLLRRRSGSHLEAAFPGRSSKRVGASQQLLRRRNGSFPTTAQEEEWELPKYCPGGGVGASQQLRRRRRGSFPGAA